MISFIHNSISIVCARIPLSYYASVHFKDTLFPMGCAAPAGSLISVVICVGAFIWLEHHEDKYQIHSKCIDFDICNVLFISLKFRLVFCTFSIDFAVESR